MYDEVNWPKTSRFSETMGRINSTTVSLPCDTKLFMANNQEHRRFSMEEKMKTTTTIIMMTIWSQPRSRFPEQSRTHHHPKSRRRRPPCRPPSFLQPVIFAARPPDENQTTVGGNERHDTHDDEEGKHHQTSNDIPGDQKNQYIVCTQGSLKKNNGSKLLPRVELLQENHLQLCERLVLLKAHSDNTVDQAQRAVGAGFTTMGYSSVYSAFTVWYQHDS